MANNIESVFPLEHGEIVFNCPKLINEGEIEDLEAWMKLMLKLIKRRCVKPHEEEGGIQDDHIASARPKEEEERINTLVEANRIQMVSGVFAHPTIDATLRRKWFAASEHGVNLWSYEPGAIPKYEDIPKFDDPAEAIIAGYKRFLEITKGDIQEDHITTL